MNNINLVPVNKIDLQPANDFCNGFFKEFGFGLENKNKSKYAKGLEVKFMNKQGCEELLPVENIKELVRMAYNAGILDGRKQGA